MLLKGSAKSPRRIAEELGVRYVLEGSVRKAGANLRITARLVDAAADAQRWADKYAGTLDEVFYLQERVSRAIVHALDLTLSADEDRSLAHRSMEDAAAYDCYLRARHGAMEASPASLDRAETLLRRALERVEDSGRLRAALAFVDVVRMRALGTTDHATLDRVVADVEAVVAREPDCGAAHFVLGTVAFERGDLRAAAGHLERARRLDPHDVDAAVWLGIVHVYAGDVAPARAMFARLRRQDPLNPFPHALASAVEWFDGRFEDGVEPMERCVELNPEGAIWRWHWGYLLALLGRVDEATEEALRMLRLQPEHPYTVHLVAMTDALHGDAASARQRLARLDLAALDPHLSFHVAECLLLTGDRERALALLAQAIDRGFHPPAFIARHDPFLASLHGEPAFEALCVEAERKLAGFRR
jgi:Flp pilus assembly protein TadD